MNHSSDFLTIGGMGHASQIAVGIALAKPNLKILCIDGDGSLLMHSGSMALNALCTNLIHVVINNGVHDSVGGQPTLAKNIRLSKLAKSFGYGYSKTVDNKEDISKSLKDAFKLNKSTFIEILSIKGVSSDLSRPNLKPTQIKKLFMDALKKMTEKIPKDISDFIEYRNSQKHLFTAGPASLIRENITSLRPCFGRGDEDYSLVEAKVLDAIKKISGHEKIVGLQGSASLALEIISLNFLYGKVLIISTGFYSDRLIKNSK